MFSDPRALRAQAVCSCRDAVRLSERIGASDLNECARRLCESLISIRLQMGIPSWHVAAWERMAGFITPEAFLNVLQDPEALRPRSGLMWFWCLEAVFREGWHRLGLEWVKRIWGPLVENGFQTCPESLFEDPAEYEKEVHSAFVMAGVQAQMSG